MISTVLGKKKNNKKKFQEIETFFFFIRNLHITNNYNNKEI
jgi:hypothetical protein